jgi:uncharacterized Zn-finger protein
VANIPLQVKEKIFSDLKPFKCDSCHMGFTQQTDVQRHFDRIHKKLKPFTCELCQEKFARNYELKQHLKTAHAETIQGIS